MQPIILLRHFADTRFNKVIHPLYIGLHIFAGELRPSGVKTQHHRTVRLTGRDGGNDFGAGHGGNPAQTGDGCSGNTEEVGKHRIFGAEILIWQVEKGRRAFFHLLDDGAQAFGAADQENIIIAVAAFEDLRVQHLIFLVRIHADERHILIERVHRHFKSREVRIEQNHFFTGSQRFVQMMFVLIAHQLAQAVGIAVPIQAVFHQEFAHMAKMRLEHPLPLIRRPFGETFGQIDAADAAARHDQVIAQHADRRADFFNQPKRQQLNHIKNQEDEFHKPFQTAFGGDWAHYKGNAAVRAIAYMADGRLMV